MAEFSASQIPSSTPNNLFNLQDVQQGNQRLQQNALVTQGTQQALTDAQTVRDNAVAVGQGDPDATATSLAADPTRAQAVLSGLQGQGVAQRAQAAWNLNQAANASGAILNLQPSQRPAAWAALRQQAIASGIPAASLPETYQGDAAHTAFRNFAIPAGAQLDFQSAYPSSSAQSPLSGPTNGASGVGPQSNAGPTPAGTYSQALGIRESNTGGTAPNYQNSNSAGYLGAYQFGNARAADLGAYTPAKGEGANGWEGTFNIPGFPQVKTRADFLASPAAQDALQNMSVANIHTAIQQTPGAANLSEAGLQAVAHLGGVTGMQRFVASDGQYNPADGNGTKLSDYYNEFAGHGQLSQDHPMLAANNNQPQPGQPAAAPQQPAQVASAQPAQPGYANMLSGIGAPPPGGGMASAPGTQVASLTGTAGLPQTATDASAAAPQTPSLPISAGAPAGMSRPIGQNQLAAAAPAGAAPQNALADVGATPTMLPTNQTAPGAAGVPDGYHMTFVKGRPAGMVSNATGMPYLAPDVKIESGNAITSNPLTHQVISSQRLFDTRAPMHFTDQTGVDHVLDQDGHQTETVGVPTYAPDMKNYNVDMADVQKASESLQADQAQQTRLIAQRNLLANGLQTGAGGTIRAGLSNYLETFMPGGGAAEAEKLLGLPPARAAQEFAKLSLVSAGGQEKDNLGSHGSYAATQLYLKANPGLELSPDANRDINNMQLVANQANQDYIQGLQSWVNTKGDAFVSSGGKTRYQSSNQFDQQWQAQRNPQIYAAATGAINQQPFAQWSKGLQPDEVARVSGIVGRVDPNATFMGPDNQPHTALPPAQAGTPAGAGSAQSQQPAASATPPTATSTTAAPAGGLAHPQSADDFNALPSGTHFLAPDGTTRIKP